MPAFIEPADLGSEFLIGTSVPNKITIDHSAAVSRTGAGAPSAAPLASQPQFYLDTSATPNALYHHNGGAWRLVGDGVGVSGGGGAPTGPAGGGLSGTYPNPSLVLAPAAVVSAAGFKDGAGVALAAGANVTTPAELTTAIAGIAPNPTTLPPNGPAGGGLSGTYPNPSVVLTAAAVLGAANLKNCAGAAHVSGASLPTCAEMNAAITTAVAAAAGAAPTATANGYEWAAGGVLHKVIGPIFIPGGTHSQSYAFATPFPNACVWADISGGNATYGVGVRDNDAYVASFNTSAVTMYNPTNDPGAIWIKAEGF